RLLFVLDGTVAARQDRHAGLFHHAPGARLVAHQPDRLRIGTDELDVAGLADFGEGGALPEKSGTGMDGGPAGDFFGADHGGHVQITVRASSRSDADVLVGKLDVELILVGLGVHGDGLDAKLAARIDDAQRDFSAVRYEDLLEHV